jgi:signal transduction histidine kinase
MRRRFALAAALPALVSLVTMALLADRLARRALEDELATRLVAAARAAGSALPVDRVVRLAPGDETSRTYGHIRARLDSVARATGTRLLVVRPDGTALADSAGRARIGERVPAVERDRLEIAQAAAGRDTASRVLFQATDGRYHKTGWAPLLDAGGHVVAVVGADGTTASFETLREFRKTVATVAVVGALLGALAAALVTFTVSRPLLRIIQAARRIATGDLQTPLWRRNRKDEIGTLRDTLEEMRRALRARDEERETLLAGIAHEVRNPLGALDLFAGLLAEEIQGRPEASHVAPQGAPEKEGGSAALSYLVRIRAELAALSKVVEEFLDYAREKPPSRGEVDLRQLVAEVAELSAPLASERQAEVVVEGSGKVRADGEQLRRAAVNLVRNALEASAPGAAVQVWARCHDGEAVIEVADRGPGLSAEARERLFRPFFTTKERGTGLGLALAKKVADAHGGRIALDDREGGGVRARLSIPVRDEVAAG